MAGRRELVTKVLDGDTFLTASRKNPVRPANVDVAERGTPGAAAPIVNDRPRGATQDRPYGASEVHPTYTVKRQ
jgi:hypothetical protein